MLKNCFIKYLSFFIIGIIPNTYLCLSQDFNIPKTYICYKTNEKILVDGLMDEKSWIEAPYTDYFVDIEGDKKPMPYKNTKVKMLWDDKYFYFLANIEEDHIWAKLRQRDTVIFYDNDFEIFIDPDGDTHNYYEFEVNAMGTYWDLFISKPYRDNGLVLNSWDISGIKIGIDIQGTINDPSDKDKKWVIEIAIPWKVLREAAKGKNIPKDGDQWRVNFSRVQWETEVLDGIYTKKKNINGKVLPENNWVWSPQGKIAMHMPEKWGYVQFSTKLSGDKFIYDKDEYIKQCLYKIYYNQRDYFLTNKSYSSNKEDIMDMELSNIIEKYKLNPTIKVFNNGYEVSLESPFTGRVWHIREDGKNWYRE